MAAIPPLCCDPVYREHPGMPALRKENEALRAERARYREALAEIRSVVHANNRPVMSGNLRIRIRDMCDAALESEG